MTLGGNGTQGGRGTLHRLGGITTGGSGTLDRLGGNGTLDRGGSAGRMSTFSSSEAHLLLRFFFTGSSTFSEIIDQI